MGRALQLAALAEGHTSPNPMVGAVVVARGRIIGEGYHRHCGGPHAEVWAVRSVAEADRPLLPEATVYVTLEPCSHYGKTPPCADMLVDCGVARVVVGSLDPNPRVSGTGVERLRQAGIEVDVGVLEQRCFDLNRRFMTAQIRRRPYILLKWAQSADGYLDRRRDASPDAAPTTFSTPLSLQDMHRVRSLHDAIVVGSSTIVADDPSLTVRNYAAGITPRPVVLDRRGRVPATSRVFASPEAIYVTSRSRTDLPATVTRIEVAPDEPLAAIVDRLYGLGITSLMVEGGARLLASFIEADLWDDARIEVAPLELGDRGTARIDMPRGAVNVARADDRNVIINVKNLASR